MTVSHPVYVGSMCSHGRKWKSLVAMARFQNLPSQDPYLNIPGSWPNIPGLWPNMPDSMTK